MIQKIGLVNGVKFDFNFKSLILPLIKDFKTKNKSSFTNSIILKINYQYETYRKY